MTTLTAHGYSKLSAFERCPRYHFNRYKRMLEPRKFSPAPTFGVLFHAARQAYFENGRSLDSAYQQIRIAASEFVLYDGFQEAAEELVMYVADAIEAYDKHYVGDKVERVAFEVPFETVIGDKPWPITGRLDGIVVTQGQVWIDECKTTGLPLSRFLPSMSMDGKTTCYVWAARKLTGKPVQGAFLDVVYKKPRKSGFEFARDISPRTEYSIDLWEKDTIELMRGIDRCEETQEWPHHYSSCSNMYGLCPYIDLCRFGETPELIAAQFVTSQIETEGGE